VYPKVYPNQCAGDTKMKNCIFGGFSRIGINTTISVNCLRYYWIVFGESGAERGK
tara:strand:- start:54 stop:218 length:165 start_codon:yes stop_codon:yes gene_type:complete